MSEENTKDLTVDEKFDLLLAEMANVQMQLAKLEAFAEDRSRDTRQMLDKIHKTLPTWASR